MDELTLWLSRGNSFELFPRRILREREYRVSLAYKIDTYDEFIKYLRDPTIIDKNVSVFSEWQFDNYMYDTLYFDIDEHQLSGSLIDRLKVAYSKLQSFRSNLLADGIDFSRVYITGRGFHAYIDFDLTNISNYYNKYLAFVDKYDNSNIVDKRIVRRRFFSRVVGSRNSRVGSGIVVRRIDFTKDNLIDAMRGVAEWKRYNGVVDILSSL